MEGLVQPCPEQEFEIEVLLERRKVSNKGKIIQANNIQLVELI